MNKRPSDNDKALIEAAILKRSSRKTPIVVDDSLSPPQPKKTTRTAVVNDNDNENGNVQKIISSTKERKNIDDEGFEYLDHTADIQLHAWGKTLSSCLVYIIQCMFNYMTNLDVVQINDEFSTINANNIFVQGHDMKNLIFTFMDEWLFIFHDTGLVVKELEIISIDIEQFTIVSSAKGEKFDLGKHTQGTEIKAITYSNMQLQQRDDRYDLWVIVDI
jgi:SHS2 domain-containing protein